MGNTNFSILLPRLLFTRAHGAELVAKAIRDRLEVAGCTVNDRNDVIIRDQSNHKDYKVGRSACRRETKPTTGFRLGVQDHPAPSVSPRDDADFVVCL